MNFRILFRPGLAYNKKLIQVVALCLTIALLFSTAILSSACKKKSDTGIVASESEKEDSVSGNSGSEETTSGTSSTNNSQSSNETSSESASETETTTEVIPREITDLIKKADSYYASGEYALASKTYRDAKSAIENSDLTGETQQLQLSLFAAKYKKAKEITDTARMHYGNAMTAQYAQQYEEAIKELKAALAIYPKYKDAVDAYENLKATKGLE